MDDDWLPPLPGDLPRVLTRADPPRYGISPTMLRRRLANGRWLRLLPRTFLTTDTIIWPDRQRAALAFAGERAVLTGAAGLDGLGIRGVRRPQLVWVLVPLECRVRSTGFVRVLSTARLPAPDLRPGPPSAPIARAIADLTRTMRRLDDVRTVVTDAVRRGHVTLEELQTVLEEGRRNGSAHLRAAIEEAGGGAWSAPEARAARLLRRAGLGPFRQNVEIALPSGRSLTVDFLWPRLRAVLEIDSDEFHELPADADRTDDRHLELETLGYSVVRRRPTSRDRRPHSPPASRHGSPLAPRSSVSRGHRRDHQPLRRRW